MTTPSMTTPSVYETALRLVRAGLSTVAIRPDGSKAATCPWGEFQNRMATSDELARMFRNGAGVGIVGGKVSGGLEILDLESELDWPEYSELVEQHAPGLLARVVHVETPSGGRHLYYRCASIGGNQKLAMRHGEDGRPKVLAETRAEGGYVLAPGSPAACHESGKEYCLIHGDLTAIPTITADERDILLTCARSFNEWSEPKRTHAATTTSGNRPGDDFNRRATWQEILEPAGWGRVGTSGERALWRRPGKRHGISATTNHGGSDLLYVFSTNAHPFEHDTSYSKFFAHCLLNQGGDTKAAARDLVASGYGEQRRRAAQTEAGEQQARTAAKPIIQIAGGSLADNVRDAEQHLADYTRRMPADGIYQRTGILVEVVRLPEATTAGGIRRAAGTLQIVSVGPDTLGLRVAQAATWRKLRKSDDSWVPVDVPERVARTLCGAVSEWRNTPALAGIVESPCLRADGSILQRPGYDSATGLYLDPGGTRFPRIPEQPTRIQAEAALAKLLEIVSGFPFVDDPSQAVAIAAMITPLVRQALRAAPLHAVTAPKMASGKTLLSYLPAYVATGKPPALMSQAEKPEEEKKRLLALLLSGSVVSVIDNMERPLQSEALCTILTEPTWTERLLGVTRNVSVSTATTWLATGNNLQFAGDLSSRVLLCAMDPECEHPEARRFEVNLHDEVPRCRGDLVAAALTIIRAYLTSGDSVKSPVFGRFEQWSRFVREPLVWLGMDDPCKTREAVASKDSVREGLANLLVAWHEVFGPAAKTVAEAVREAGANDTLRAAMIAIAEEKGGSINTRRLGNFIAKHERRIESALRYERAGSRSGVTQWRATSKGG